MWSKITSKLAPNRQLYLKPNKSEAALQLASYNDAQGLDFSDGPLIPERKISLPVYDADSRYRINEHTIKPYIEALALEPLVRPVMPAAQPIIVIQPPTPPWASVPVSRHDSENSSDDEGYKRTHRKASSDTLLQPNAARSDAARREQEAAAAFEAIGRALVDMQIQQASSVAQRKINYSYPLNRQPKRESAPPDLNTRLEYLAPTDVPQDNTPPDDNTPPFEFDD